MAEEKSPRVFISYSWNSEAHQKSVLELAKQLRTDGVDVDMDVWDLKKGNNIHKFMESMVASKDIDRVLLIVDRTYRDKADSGKGGVGIETEIVSSHIYNQANQEKFIPVVWEKDEEGSPFLPAFLKSRFFIDLSQGNRTDEYPELLRTIYNKPKNIKPALGQMPAFLKTDGLLSVPTSFGAIESSAMSRNPSGFALIERHLFNDLKEQIRLLILANSTKPPTDDEVVSKIQSFEPILTAYDLAIDNLVAAGSANLLKELKSLFEFCLANYSFYEPKSSFYENQFSAVRFVTQEIFLHTLAIIIRNEKFEEAKQLLEMGVVHSKQLTRKLGSIVDIYEPVTMLDEVRNTRLKLQRVSVTADLLKERAMKTSVSFEELAEADLVMFLRATFTHQFWYPRTVVYFNEYHKFPIFLRSESASFFQQFSKVIGVKDKNDFVQKWQANRDLLSSFRQGWRPFGLEQIYNVEKIATR